MYISMWNNSIETFQNIQIGISNFHRGTIYIIAAETMLILLLNAVFLKVYVTIDA